MADVEIVHVRDVSSGRVHKRFRTEGSRILASFEGDNADTAGAYSVLTDAELAEVDRDALCKRCFRGAIAPGDVLGADE